MLPSSAHKLSRPDAENIKSLIKDNPRAAIERLRAYAAQGDAQIQLLLGQMLINVIGSMRDPREALHWFRNAAASGVPMAMNMVGRCLENGLGTDVDYGRAAAWYHRAATFECTWAIYNYAHMLASGRGVQKDRTQAFLWFKLAASRGHARAMAFLGQYYEQGWETPSDLKLAISLYRRSAHEGDYRGQCTYASVLAEDGKIDEALYWLQQCLTTAPARYLAQLDTVLRQSSHPTLREFADTVRAKLKPIESGNDLAASAAQMELDRYQHPR